MTVIRTRSAIFAISMATFAVFAMSGCVAMGKGADRAAPAAAVSTPPIDSPQTDFTAMAERLAAYRAIPDTAGTGRFPALKQTDPQLPSHTIYRPADLEKLGKGALAIVGWGNGGCVADGASERLHLSEIASHGYVVIAPGTIKSGPGVASQPVVDPRRPLMAETTAAQVMQGIEWILAENARPDSPYFQKVDPTKIAVSGYSCGGLQALQIASDPRVKAVVLHNTGLFPEGAAPIAGIVSSKSWLAGLHTPVVYIEGGKTDIAYQNGMDDFSRISHVPVAMLNLDVGHGGTFHDPNGGEAARGAVAWLEWQLRGDPKAARLFTGKDCQLCTDSRWTVERKNIDR